MQDNSGIFLDYGVNENAYHCRVTYCRETTTIGGFHLVDLAGSRIIISNPTLSYYPIRVISIKGACRINSWCNSLRSIFFRSGLGHYV